MKSFVLYRFTALLLAATLAAVSGCGVLDEETYHPPEGEGPWILVDLYHSRKQNPEDYRLAKGDYSYQGVFGFARAFDHMESNGYKWASIRDMPLSAERLEGFDVLFINLVDDTRPNFSAQEREDIRQWVEDGGGLFVIGDHTNVYYHAERINPLLAPMGIEVTYHTIVDYPPEFSVAGLAWIMVFDFADHYLGRGVDMISFQTGAPLRTDYGVAFTSERSWADFWDESDRSGFYGNWTHDGDDELEPRGPQPVVAAREYGEGRVVVAGDQNAFGDAWLHYGNNFELLMNAMQWLAGEENKPPLRAARPQGLNIGLDLLHDEFLVGRKGADGYYVFFVNLNRDQQVTASARMGISGDDDVLMLMQPDIGFDEVGLDRIRTYFDEGKTVVLSFEADQMPRATVELIQQIAPEFSVRIDGADYRFGERDAAELTGLDIPRIGGPLEVSSPTLDVDGLRLGALRPNVLDGQNQLSPYLLSISSTWGDPLVTANHEGNDVDIARRKSIGDGELIIFIQDGFWRNRTLGDGETTPPTRQNADAVALQYRLLDYLKQSDDQ